MFDFLTRWFIVPHDVLLSWVFWLLVLLVGLRFIEVLIKIGEAYKGEDSI